MGAIGYYARYICVVKPDGYCSISTDDPRIDLERFALTFGGGGHKSAARITLSQLAPDSTATSVEKGEAIEQLYSAFVDFITLATACHFVGQSKDVKAIPES